MKRSKEIKIGVTMAVAIALLVVGINFMADKSWFSSQRVLYAKYNGIDGLDIGNKVVHNGFPVGTVKRLIMDGEGKIVVEFVIIHEELKIPRGTIANIKGGIMENKSIDLLFP
ncbi:MAG: MCE family protein, partial [Bacteroidetes bacterium]|nr:MCE family protein [Bacteroidota bacterium]